ncbi:MAG: hypothetical protein AAFV53_04760 [Myxococcota bacterium]
MNATLNVKPSIGSNGPIGAVAAPLLAPAGPSVVLGEADPLIGPVSPDACTLFGPRGACLLDEAGPLWICDTGHHRLLGWRQCPTEDHQPADWIIGQPSVYAEGRNALGEPGPETLNVPTGINPFGDDGLVVSDGWNNRVLIWKKRPEGSHVPADIVLGQRSFQTHLPNHGTDQAEADSMHWPFQALTHQGMLFVADTGNRRVLIWKTLPEHAAQPADIVLGQGDLRSRSDNGGQAAGPAGMRWPHDLAILDGNLVVTDAGNNRILIWDGIPTDNNTPADIVLGQKDFAAVDHNQGQYWPWDAKVNMPYAVSTHRGWILTADTGNSRLMGWKTPFTHGAPASHMSGQPHWRAKGDNRWQAPARDSVCWPYGIQAIGNRVVLADTGNHRVVLWDFAEGIG